jgi:hypothetical protein
MTAESLDHAYAAELLQRQDALQAEARQIMTDLDLMELLQYAGRPEQVGSSVSGLMVWRDLDLNVLCQDLTIECTFETLRPLLTDPRVVRAEYRNETGRHTPAELRGDERYYFVVRYETPEDHEWKIDLAVG